MDVVVRLLWPTCFWTMGSQAAMKSLADDTFNGVGVTAKTDSLSESTEGDFEGKGPVNHRENNTSPPSSGACRGPFGDNGEGGIRTRGTVY